MATIGKALAEELIARCKKRKRPKEYCIVRYRNRVFGKDDHAYFTDRAQYEALLDGMAPGDVTVLWGSARFFADFGRLTVAKAKADLVLHHDDPPCEARLKEGYCPECRLRPDMQSTCLWPYCPSCKVPLRKLRCPGCGQDFENPCR